MHTILVVDDDPAIRHVIRLHLEEAGCEVLCAAGGDEAARLIASRRFDLLLTDLLMPDRDGLELIRGLRKTHPKLPIVAMTGGGLLSADMYLDIARGLHVDGVLGKPFGKDELCTLVRGLLELAQPRSHP